MWFDLRKIIITTGIILGIILVVIAVTFQSSESEIKQVETQIVSEPDVIMSIKVSRPGCEETDSCYIPSKITVNQGQTVTWKNEDVAFHSVTSGSYDKPSSLFDSGHLDPEQRFSVTFDKQGTIDYFCTLHPWMAGKIVVE